MGMIRKQLLLHTDARIKLCTEVVTGIKAIKLYAWEVKFSTLMHVSMKHSSLKD